MSSIGFRVSSFVRSVAVATTVAALAAVAAAMAAEEAPLALAGNDPVLLTAGETVAGREDLVATHEGLRYRFAGAETRDRFVAEPDRYAIQNESCPVVPGASPDPSIFAVHEGRIYTFATPQCKTDFLAAPERYVGAAAGAQARAGGAPARERRTVAILVYDGVELLDFAGPGEVFAAARGRFDVFTVGPTTAPVLSQGFVEVTPRYGVASAPRADILVLPGGAVGGVIGTPAVMDWIRKTAGGAEQVLSVCNGALILAEAGLLDGLEATTHQGSLAALRQRATRTTVHSDRRFVDNGKVVTAAGVSAGIDMSLHVVAKLLGADAARATARYMEYAWKES
jgi:putative intracellular protease/amidase/YHS domain-containing protein